MESNHPLSNVLHNPIMEMRNLHDRASLRAQFPELNGHTNDQFLALRRYLNDIPERFFSRVIYEYFVTWLNQRDAKDRNELQTYIGENLVDLDRSLRVLRDINAEPWHDELLPNDSLSEVRFADKTIHPTYLRLLEGVLHPFIKLVAHFLRRDRGKRPDALDIYNCYEELSKGPTSILVGDYHHVIRNGIAHGGITYLDRVIRYHDKRGNEVMHSVLEIVQMCDDLLDTCNGFAAALKLFLILQRSSPYPMLRELLIEELQEETQSPWWTIEGCIQSEIGLGCVDTSTEAR